MKKAELEELRNIGIRITDILKSMGSPANLIIDPMHFNLGELINSQFVKFYEYIFGGDLDLDELEEFKNTIFDFFDRQYTKDPKDSKYHSYLFNYFTPIHNILSLSEFRPIIDLWNFVLKMAYEYEDSRNRKDSIHKGTPYWFRAVACIYLGDLRKGFASMHQAIEEDKKFGVDGHAYRFVTLNSEHKLLTEHKTLLKGPKRLIEEKIKIYQDPIWKNPNSRAGKLSFQDFRSKFLESLVLFELVTDFSYRLFSLVGMLEMDRYESEKNIFFSTLHVDIIFPLCRIIENIIKRQKKYKLGPNETLGVLNYCLEFLSKNCSPQLNLHIHINKRRALNKDDFDINFEKKTLPELLVSKFMFLGNIKPTPIEEDLAIVNGLRNLGAHDIEGQAIIYENFENICEKIFNALFFCIENLY